ncbi:unnamed protein product [Owenia fusiformis]|uniref:Ig-like domain-containing protein n=1 Tax=Owenia fusiformis TaxID=6347 RepID=A0A8S4P8B6_OWEFU|nr:unnamed protein product [Owenia fusiformis]
MIVQILIALLANLANSQEVVKSGEVHALSGDITTLPCDVPFPGDVTISWFKSHRRDFGPTGKKLIYTNVNNPNRETTEPNKYKMDDGDNYNLNLQVNANEYTHHCAVILSSTDQMNGVLK